MKQSDPNFENFLEFFFFRKKRCALIFFTSVRVRAGGGFLIYVLCLCIYLCIVFRMARSPSNRLGRRVVRRPRRRRGQRGQQRSRRPIRRPIRRPNVSRSVALPRYAKSKWVARRDSEGVYDLTGCNDPCAICMDDLSNAELIATLPCTHQFCTACIDKWFEHGKQSCPTCRAT